MKLFIICCVGVLGIVCPCIQLVASAKTHVDALVPIVDSASVDTYGQSREPLKVQMPQQSRPFRGGWKVVSPRESCDRLVSTKGSRIPSGWSKEADRRWRSAVYVKPVPLAAGWSSAGNFTDRLFIQWPAGWDSVP